MSDASSSRDSQLVVSQTSEPLSRAAVAGTAPVELTGLSDGDWSTASVLQLADESTLDTGADLTGLADATGNDELSVGFDADFDTDDLQQPQCHHLTTSHTNEYCKCNQQQLTVQHALHSMYMSRRHRYKECSN